MGELATVITWPYQSWPFHPQPAIGLLSVGPFIHFNQTCLAGWPLSLGPPTGGYALTPVMHKMH